jgi:hypothetical protein
VAATHTDTGRPPGTAVVFSAWALLALIATQLDLARLSRHRINPGLATASLQRAGLAVRTALYRGRPR